MNTLFPENENVKKSNKILIGALTAAVLAVAAAIALFSLKPSAVQVEQEALENAFREGSPEFQNYTKKIVAQTNEDATTKSPTAMGTVMMSIGGTIRNFTGKTLTGLELKVGVVDTFGGLLRERDIIIIPKQRESLENNQTMPVRVIIEGFDPKADIANIRWKVTAIKVENPE
ncbi:MAG: hypothetical protein ACR2L1_00515 [Pyrinomonadaceae bacterium]